MITKKVGQLIIFSKLGSLHGYSTNNKDAKFIIKAFVVN